MMTNVAVSSSGRLQALRDAMPRDEFFAGLYILGCVNGLGLRVIQSVDQLGWTGALLATFQVSGIIWMACLAGVWLILRDKTDQIRLVDLVVGAGFLVLVTVPIGAASWVAVTALSLYILLFTNAHPSRRRGAVILLATAVPMFWSPLLFRFFANFILKLDASLVGWLLGTTRTGNMVRFADDFGYLVIFPACSSLANVSLAFLCWVMISQLTRHRWSPQDAAWCLLACASVIAVNVTRISIMGLSPAHYAALHNPQADLVASLIILAVTVACCLLGVRRELFSRA